MEKVNLLIIGAGCIGLALGRELSQSFEDVVIVEKEDSFGRHTSSRNSEVIHSGIYYPPNSLKAKLCVWGRELLYDYLQKNSIPHKMCGKLVIAANENEIDALLSLEKNGRINGIDDLNIISAATCRNLAPKVKAHLALLVSCTGIMDSHAFMKSLKLDFENNDGFLIFDQEVIAIKNTNEGYLVDFSNGEVFLAKTVINCAGLDCQKIADLAGIDTEAADLKIHWCKAEYYKTSEKFDFQQLIYPLPDPSGMFLGIHLTFNLADEVRFGPSAYYVDDIDYSMDDTFRQDFVNSVSKYLVFDPDKIHPDDTGIRAKLQGEKDGFRDFYIQEETARGKPSFINLMGIDSPGLTSSMAIASYVRNFISRPKK